LLLFQAPHSYTGEDLAELHIPSSAALLRMLVDELLRAGARPADPGEFSARAFFAGKIDLTEAEGIAATISAANNVQLRAAASLRDGALHRWTHTSVETLVELLAALEAGIDFTEEEGVSFISADQVRWRLQELIAEISRLTCHAVRWERLDALPVAILTGRPNVGKSSLINALAGHDRAIVSPLAGTTRDALSAILLSPQGPIRLVDVAGIEASPTPLSQDMNLARQRILREADLVLLVVDDMDTVESVNGIRKELTDWGVTNILTVRNKVDILDPQRGSEILVDIAVSALHKRNLPALKALISDSLALRPPGAIDAMTLNARHREGLGMVTLALHRAVALTTEKSFRMHPELLATELRDALNRIGSITGAISPDDVLGKIFGSFCIGK